MNRFYGNRASLNKITLDLEKARECFVLPILSWQGWLRRRQWRDQVMYNLGS